MFPSGVGSVRSLRNTSALRETGNAGDHVPGCSLISADDEFMCSEGVKHRSLHQNSTWSL